MSQAQPNRAPCGILVVDKPMGCTSHDVVAWARRAFATREVGHAGTLDPAATGVLLLLVGEATKLSSWMTAEHKVYETTVRFGATTDTLDADGVLLDGPAEGLAVDAQALTHALASMVGPLSQTPPAVSAIKIGGVRAHERVRRGETVSLPARDVVLEHATITGIRGADVDITLGCSKGFYVRSFAQDLAARLGTIAHLRALRRTRSGCFDVRDAFDGARLRAARDDSKARSDARAHLRVLATLEGQMPTVRLGADAVAHLHHGRIAPAPEHCHDGVVLVFLDRDDHALPPQPIGLARREPDGLRPERNFAPPAAVFVRQAWIDG